VGATVRIYFEKYEKTKTELDNALALQDLVKLALSLSKIKEFTQRDQPSVIT
jgi:phosphoglucomutase